MPVPESKDYDLINRLAEEFAARFRNGERPALSDYVERYPDLAADIRELFPALVEMEQVEAANGPSAPAAAAAAAAQSPVRFDRLGDFRILREVGRGGMGIVYEAEQLSLGRRVALKVLPRQVLLDRRQQRRFEREAKAAARLHHTNIVPVFGVGEQDGVHYYVMQFIQGLGLDEVLDELQRMQPGPARNLGALRQPAGAEDTRRGAVAAPDVVQSLLDAKWAVTVAAVRPEDEEQAPPVSGTTVRFAERESTPPDAAPARSETAAPGQFAGPLSASSSAVGATATLSGLREAAPGTKGGPETYWHSVARIGSQVARALQHAHDQGILHRDIKPSNLLLDLRGTVWVTDFGLAKANDELDLTHTGDVMGTLRYISPEAFDGRTDVRSDVYSLGLTLYELAALRPAFDTNDRQRLIRLVTTSAPPRLDAVRRDVPRDLATMIHKAIDRDPRHRYQTARELAEDLERFIADEPIQARQLPLTERLVRWSRRNRSLAALLVLLMVAAGGASLAAAVFLRQKDAQVKLALDNERLARERTAQRNQADDARRDVERTLTEMSTERGLLAEQCGKMNEALLWFAHAARLAGDDAPRRRANLARAASYSGHAPRPVRLLQHPAEWIESLSFDATGRFLITRGSDGSGKAGDVRVWDLERGAERDLPEHAGRVTAAAFDGKSSRLAIGTSTASVLVVELPAGKVQVEFTGAGPIADLAFSPSGKWLAAAAGRVVRLHNLDDQAAPARELDHGATVLSVTMSPDGERLATIADDSRLRVFGIATDSAQPLWPPLLCNTRLSRADWEPQYLVRPTFVDQGRRLLYVVGKDVAALALGDGTRQIQRVSLPELFPHSVCVSPDQQRFFAWGYRQGRTQPRAAGQSPSEQISHRHLQAIYDARFTADGMLLLTAGADRFVRFWSATGGQPTGLVLEHPAAVSAVSVSPEGRRFATAQQRGLIVVWEQAQGATDARSVPLAERGSASFATLTHDGRYLAATGSTYRDTALASTQVVETATGAAAGKTCAVGGILLDARFSPDGNHLATICSNEMLRERRHTSPGRQIGKVHFWDWRTGRLAWGASLASEPRSLDFSPDGARLAVLTADGTVRVMDGATGAVLSSWQAHPPFPDNNWYIANGKLAFAPDGRRLLTWSTDKFVRVWDAGRGTLEYAIEHSGKTDSVAVSRDGARLASSCWGNNEVRVSDFATGKLLAPPLPHPDWAFSVDFSPDGSLLVTGCRDSIARVWNWRAGRLACPPLEHENEVHVARFTLDGRRVLTASDDATARVWDSGDGKPVTPPIRLAGMGWSMALNSTGTHAVVGGLGGALRVIALGNLDIWDSLSGAAAESYAELLSCRRIEAGGDQSLTTEEWLNRYGAAREALPALFEIDWTASR